MIQASDILQAGSFHARLFSALESTSQYARNIRLAASACIDNFRWLSATKRRHIVLLDFDVVFGALQQMRNRQPISLPENDEFPLAPMTFVGESALGYLLQQIPEYALPPGSVAELLRRQNHLRQSLSQGARRFLKNANDLRGFARDRGQAATAMPHDTLDNLIREDVTNFIEDLQGVTFLERVLEKANSVRQYLRDPEEASEEPLRVLQNSYAYLNIKRPTQRKQRNNFYDALNAATVATLLSSSGNEAPVPIFVTQTRSIRSFGEFGFQNLLSRYATKLPFSLTNSPLFLSVFEALLALTEQRYLPAADQAQQLLDDADSLAIAAEALLHHCNMQEAKGEFIGSFSTLPQGLWEMLLFRRDTFSEQWNKIFEPLQVAAKRDFAEAAQFSEMRLKDTSTIRPEDRQALEELRSHMRASASIDDRIWDLVVQVHSDAQSWSSRIPQTLELPFTIVLSDATGELLRTTPSVGQVERFDASVIDGSHSLEVNMVPTMLKLGAVFRVVSLRNLQVSERRYLRLSWCHALAKREAVSKCWRLLSLPRELRNEAKMIVYCGNAVKSEIVPENLEEESWADNLENAQLVEFRVRFERSFVDLQPIDDVEMQISLTVEDRKVDSDFIERISGAIEATSVTTIPKGIARELLLRCLAAVHVRSDSRR